MTLAERVQLIRAEEQMSLAMVPEPSPASRMECACGCGVWFYVERAKHCPAKYATPACRLRVKRQRQALVRRRAGMAREGTPECIERRREVAVRNLQKMRANRVVGQ